MPRPFHHLPQNPAPRTRRSFAWPLAALSAFLLCPAANGTDLAQHELDTQFAQRVRPFLESYCINCHGAEKPKADFDLSPYSSMEVVMRDHLHWDLVLEQLQSGEMPPEKAKKHPAQGSRDEVIAWIQAARRHEGRKNAGDPGPVLARRLSNAEYDYSIRDLTGVDIRPTREFPVDPANQAGFDNSGESLAMSTALVKKYMQAARTVAEHLVLKPDGFEFAPHPVVADTDRDKYFVLRIVDFYKRQPTDYADYFAAAWRFQHRVELGKPAMTLADAAADEKVSAKYLARVWTALTGAKEDVGPIAKLQTLWRALPAPSDRKAPAAMRQGCEQMRDFVVQLREKLIPEVKNLEVRGIHNGSQTMVMWKNRQMAANRRRHDPAALQTQRSDVAEKAAPGEAQAARKRPSGIPDEIQKGGKFLPPAITTQASSATSKMAAAKNRESDPDLVVPIDAAERAPHETAFARFADLFPDAFYITERARVYMDAVKEQENAGRLLSAGLHSMTGYFRDDGPLYDLVLDAAGQRELDRLWQEFDFAAAISERMHTSFVWFERTDSSYMRDPEFDPFRPEDKSALSQEKIKALGELYLAKAQRNEASEAVQQAVRDHFESVGANIRKVEKERAAAVPSHLKALEVFAERAFRRPLTPSERESLVAFYRESREENGVDHEEAMRDSIVGVLMSPKFLYRVDLGDLAAKAEAPGENAARRVQPLTDHALASRLSYFLWSSLPDAELLARAAAGDLHRPEVLAAQARRMLKDARIRNFAAEFAGNWLDFRRFEEHNSVDRERFPAFDNELRSAMFEEPIRFFVDVVREDRSVLYFLHGDYTHVNAPLARHYGMNDVNAGAREWVRVERASRFGRGGLLPMAVFLTANSPGLRTSPVKRGYWVVRRVLGERIPPPPATVPELPNDEQHLGDLTLREALAKHREDKSCATCHARFDSFGLVFENYGPVGELREKDFGGRPVDTRAEFPGGVEGQGFAGLRKYVQEHREHDFIDNLCRKLLAYALGRTLIPSDDSVLDSMRARLAKNGYRFANLVETIVTSPQFLNKRVPEGLAKQ